MQRCPVCNGRTLLSEEGIKCMDIKCTGAQGSLNETGTVCHCGEKMHYTGLNSWGEPNYSCFACGATVKL